MTTKTTFSERLNFILDQEGFPPKNRGRIQLIAEIFGLTHRGASKWINGETCPPLKKYALIADKFKIDEQWLRTGSGNPNLATNTTDQALMAKQHLVKVYHTDTFLNPNKAPIKEIYCDCKHQGNLIAIELETEAMSPRFPNHSIIIFDDQKTYQDGDFVLVRSKAFPALLFRQLLVCGDLYYLNAHNPKFDRLTLDPSDQILGVMIQAILVFS